MYHDLKIFGQNLAGILSASIQNQTEEFGQRGAQG